MDKSNEMTRFGDLGKLERGEKIPNVAMVLRVANLFDVSVDQLVRDELEVE